MVVYYLAKVRVWVQIPLDAHAEDVGSTPTRIGVKIP